ncbi:hypothetical protein [Actinomadura rayongensis]|uniref:SLATT domain-containing protein n=1 Tax=Actinomadura rayongensis TaxID=1429076 RepID=A0A6I4VXM8_9ACTN|nr:hypothetical protein [Actinomadura rayongensis]MXQ63129.1 hypothetical protein [Actinomadura rayongensis]
MRFRLFGSRSSHSDARRLQAFLDERIGHVPDDMFEAFERLYQSCKLSADEQLRSSKRWQRMYYSLGVPSAVLAAASGVTGLALTTGRVPAGFIALVAAGLTGAATSLSPVDRQQKSDILHASWERLAGQTSTHLIHMKDRRRWEEPDAPVSAEDLNRYLHLIDLRSRLLRGDTSAFLNQEGPPA